METEEKALQGLGGNAWQTVSGRSMEAILTDMMGTIGSVSIIDALQQAAFLLCCDIIAQDVSKAPLRLVRMVDNRTSEVVKPKGHKMARMLALDPNSRHTWREFMEMSAYWFALTTNSYHYIKRNRMGVPIELVPLQSSRVIDLAYAPTGEVFYEVTASTWQEQALLGFQSKRVPERDMIHVRGRMLDGFSGFSTLSAGQSTLELGAAISDYQTKLFGEDGQIRGVFTKKQPGELTEIAFQRLKAQFRELMRKFRDNMEPIVLEDGLEFSSISSNPQEAELSKQLEASIVNTCRLLRIPPHKAFHLVNVKYENMEVLEKSYIGDTLEPIFQLYEQRFTRHLLSEEDRLDDMLLQFDREAVALRDPKVLTEQVKTLLGYGAMEFNEARAKFGMNPFAGGDARLVPVNMRVVGRDNEVILDAAAQQPDTPADPAADTNQGKGLRLAVNNE